MDSEGILGRLRERLSAAQQRNQAAANRFNDIIRNLPSGTPASDGVVRIQDAARSYRNAMRELGAAQEQLTEFLLNGAVPEDLDLGPLN